MLCLRQSLISFRRIGESEVRCLDMGGSHLRVVSKRLLHMQGSSGLRAVSHFVNISIVG